MPAGEPRDPVSTPPVCAHCGQALAGSALFCPSCGEERPGYAERLRHLAPPVVPEFMERLRTQGRPMVRILVAILACLAAGLPALLLLGGDLGKYLLFLDALMVAAVTACALAERRALRGLWAPGPVLAWVAGGAAALALPLLAQAYLSLFPDEVRAGGEEALEGLSPALLVVTMCLVPGIFEEIAFRGIVLETARVMMRPRSAALLTAALFAGMHFQPLIFPYHFLGGILLGVLRLKSGSLLPGMFAHAVHNAAVVFLYREGS